MTREQREKLEKYQRDYNNIMSNLQEVLKKEFDLYNEFLNKDYNGR